MMGSESKDIKSIPQEVSQMLQHPIEPRYTAYPMRVSGKVVKQISTGIYRSPGNVIKELVSNSFDADASFVHVETDKPEFRSFRVYDDGEGMSASEFKIRMQRIGASLKGIGDKTKKGRPIIGRIGIGLLAVAHVSRRFTMIAGKEGEEQGFEAKVDMSRLFQVEAETQPLEELTAGSIQLKMYSKPKSHHYTMIHVENVSETFKEQLMANYDEGHFDGFDSPKPTSYEKFVQQIQVSEARISKLAGYDQLLWELGLLAPVKYLDKGPVIGIRGPVITSIKQRIDSYDFSLYVDRTEIRKPILFPAENDHLEPEKDFGVYPLKIKITGDNPISAEGYLYHQVKRIKPPELRGLIPRIRGVGIGLPSENRFRILTESPVITFQVSGELYVDEGLDEALNIDRSSFFEADPSFRKLRDELERILKEEDIIKEIRERGEERREEKHKTKLDSERDIIRTLAEEGGVRNPTIRHVNAPSEKLLELDISSRTITLYKTNIPKKYRGILQYIALCFELAQHSKNPNPRFYELLNVLVSKLKRYNT